MTAEAPSRKPRLFLIALIILFCFLFLVVAAVYFAPSFLPVGMIRDLARDSVRKSTGMNLDFRSLSFSWTGGIKLEGVTLSPVSDTGDSAEPFAVVDELSAEIPLMPLLSGRINVRRFAVDGFAVRLRRDADGGLNIPDFSGIAIDKKEQTAEIPITTVEKTESGSLLPKNDFYLALLPAVEISQVELNRGVFTYDDVPANLNAEIELTYFRLEGGKLDAPFEFTGKIVPFPSTVKQGAIPFSGMVSLVRNLNFDPNGSAALHVEFDKLPLAAYAARFGLESLLPSGELAGRLDLTYDKMKGRLETEGVRIANLKAGFGGQIVDIPDTGVQAAMDYDYSSDRLAVALLAADSTLIRADGQGWIGGVRDLAAGGFPTGEVDFNGAFNIPVMLSFGSSFLPELGRLSNIDGDVGFKGNWSLGKSGDNPAVPAMNIAVDLNDGAVAVKNIVPGVSAAADFGGIGAAVSLILAEPLSADANLNFVNVPLTLAVDAVASPIAASVNGGAAFQLAPGVMLAELRLQNSRIDVPGNQWSGELRVANPELRLVADLEKDVVDISAAEAIVNDQIRAGVRAGRIAGLFAGKPEGSLDAELTMLLETAAAALKPQLPPELEALSGSVRAAARTVFSGERMELAVNMEAEAVKAAYGDPGLKIAAEAEKSAVGFAAGMDLGKPGVVDVSLLRLENSGFVLQAVDAGNESAAARLGETSAQFAGTLDLVSPALSLSTLQAQSTGLSAAAAVDGVQVATLVSGPWLMRAAATAEEPLFVRFGGKGEFNLREIEAGIDNLVFGHIKDGSADESPIGNLRAKIVTDGALAKGPGPEDYPRVNLRRLEFLANPMAAQARGVVRLDNLTMAMEYAARFAPSRIKSLLAYLELPPELVTAAEASGKLSWDGVQVASAGVAKGSLQFSAGDASPFSLSHDLSANYSPAEESLEVTIRGLAGGVLNAGGESIVTLNAQPSSLSIGPNGAKGFVDFRINGAAAATRHMAYGVACLIPALYGAADVIETIQADGVYNTWIQVQGRDDNAAVLKIGGIWQGAAMSLNGSPFLAEPGRLGASIDGEYRYGEKRFDISKLSFNSDSAQIRAEGSASARFGESPAGAFGLSDVGLALRFVMGDLTRVAVVFPGVIPAGIGATGGVEGQFRAGGDSDNLVIQEGVVRFAGIQARPGGMAVAIPQGTATFGGNFSLNPAGTYADDGSDFVPLRMFNVGGGTVSLTGGQIEGRNVTDLSAAFQLRGGVFTLDSARFALSGEPQGTASVSGSVDFNRPAPAVNLNLSAANMPLAQFTKELSDFLIIESGAVNVPANPGSAANIAFSGFSEPEILASLGTRNLNFATGPLRLRTGPVINAELDRARLLLRQEAKGDDSEDRIFTFESVSGTVDARGDGVIRFPSESPIRVVGDNTGNFAIQGVVNADMTIDIEAMVTGGLEKILTFSLPSIIPNLGQQSADQQSQFMNRMNQNAANGNYRIRVSGPLKGPQISGIPELVARMLTDIPLAAPFAVVGGVLNLGRNLPGTVINAPQNITRGIGGILGTITGQGSNREE